MLDYKKYIQSIGLETALTCWELIKITVPVVVATKILEEVGLIAHFSSFLEPLMLLVGLPGSLGLVWATAILTNIYGAMAVFAELAPGLHLTVAQTTTLCSLMLIAHSLPLELSISKKAGAGFGAMGILRLGGALFYGILLRFFYGMTGISQEPAGLLFHAQKKSPAIGRWAIEQGENLLLLIIVVFGIILAMRLLKITGILGLLEKILAPVLPFFGMSREAAPLTVVGIVMGISYGGALIIREACSGRLSPREIFHSLALMGLCHSLVEDTLLMVALGGSLVGILWGRILFSLAVVLSLVGMLRLLSDKRSAI